MDVSLYNLIAICTKISYFTTNIEHAWYYTLSFGIKKKPNQNQHNNKTINKQKILVPGFNYDL